MEPDFETFTSGSNTTFLPIFVVFVATSHPGKPSEIDKSFATEGDNDLRDFLFASAVFFSIRMLSNQAVPFPVMVGTTLIISFPKEELLIVLVHLRQSKVPVIDLYPSAGTDKYFFPSFSKSRAHSTLSALT